MQYQDKKYLFEEMPVQKALIAMAVPTIISQLINLVYNVVDTFFIGRTGNSNMVAAVSVAYTLYIMTVAFGNLFGVGGGSLLARLNGSGNSDQAKNVSAYSFFGAIVIALSYSLVIGVFCDPLLKLLGASAKTIKYSRQYVYTVVVAGDVPIILSAVLAHLLRNAGYSRQASLGLSAGGILNIALDPLFMFVLFPCGMEVFGAALATLLSNCAACIYLFITYKKVGNNASLSTDFRLVKEISPENKRKLYSVGVPSAILTGLFDVANMFLYAIMSGYGDEAVAALGIVMKAERLPNAVNIGICQGMMPIIAYNYSSGNKDRMKKVISFATLSGFVICFVSMGLFELLAKPITSVFLDKESATALGAEKTLSYAVSFLMIRCLASPLQFMNYRTSFCMQATGNGHDTLIHAIMREAVFYVPFMYLLNWLFGLNGLVFSLVAGEGFGMLTALFLLYIHPITSQNKGPTEE